MSLCESLADCAVSAIRINDPIAIDASQTVGDAITAMQKTKKGCTVITEHGKPIGVFTERDIVTKVLGPNVPFKTSIVEIMTTPLKVVREGYTLAEVIHTMHDGGFRHLPVVDQAGLLTGIVSVRGIVEYMVEHFPAAVFNLPPDPSEKQVSREGA